MANEYKFHSNITSWKPLQREDTQGYVFDDNGCSFPFLFFIYYTGAHCIYLIRLNVPLTLNGLIMNRYRLKIQTLRRVNEVVSECLLSQIWLLILK